MQVAYCLGFAFLDDLSGVYLIRKDQGLIPRKWNGLGGKILQDETDLEAMVRHCNKLTSFNLPKHHWELGATVTSRDNSWKLYVYSARTDFVNNFTQSFTGDAVIADIKSFSATPPYWYAAYTRALVMHLHDKLTRVPQTPSVLEMKESR